MASRVGVDGVGMGFEETVAAVHGHGVRQAGDQVIGLHHVKTSTKTRGHVCIAYTERSKNSPLESGHGVCLFGSNNSKGNKGGWKASVRAAAKRVPNFQIKQELIETSSRGKKCGTTCLASRERLALLTTARNAEAEAKNNGCHESPTPELKKIHLSGTGRKWECVQKHNPRAPDNSAQPDTRV